MLFIIPDVENAPVSNLSLKLYLDNFECRVKANFKMFHFQLK